MFVCGCIFLHSEIHSAAATVSSISCALHLHAKFMQKRKLMEMSCILIIQQQTDCFVQTFWAACESQGL